jgi:hypothetical protein
MPRQQAPESARCVPDPLLLFGVGSGHETTDFLETSKYIMISMHVQSVVLTCSWLNLADHCTNTTDYDLAMDHLSSRHHKSGEKIIM